MKPQPAVRTPGSSRPGTRRVAVLLFLAAALASTELAAQETTDDGAQVPVMTLEEAVRQALEYSPATVDLRESIQVAEERILAAGDMQDPEIRIQAGHGSATPSNTGGVNSVGYRIGARFFPPNPWLRGTNKRRERALLNAEKARLRQAEWEIAADVALLFAEVQFYDKDLELLDELLARYEKSLRLVQQRSKEGQATGNDIVSASRRYLKCLSDRDQALHDRRRALRDLASTIGARMNTLRLPAMDDAIPTRKLSHVEEYTLEGMGLMNRPELTAIQWQKRAAMAARNEARAAWIPWLQHVQLSYSQDYTDELLVDESREEWRIDAAIRIPIFSWLSHTPDLRTREVERAAAVEKAAIRNSYVEIRNALDAVRGAEEDMADYAIRTAPTVREIESILENLKNETTLSPVDAARIDEELLENKRLRLRAVFEYHKSVILLEKLTGQHLPPG